MMRYEKDSKYTADRSDDDSRSDGEYGSREGKDIPSL